MLIFRKKDLAKGWSFYDVYIVNYAKAAKAKHLNGSREKPENTIEEKGDKYRLLEFKHAK